MDLHSVHIYSSRHPLQLASSLIAPSQGVVDRPLSALLLVFLLDEEVQVVRAVRARGSLGGYLSLLSEERVGLLRHSGHTHVHGSRLDRADWQVLDQARIFLAAEDREGSGLTRQSALCSSHLCTIKMSVILIMIIQDMAL